MNVNVNKTLVGRAVEFCNNTNIDLLKYILDDKYAISAKCSIKNNFCFKFGLQIKSYLILSYIFTLNLKIGRSLFPGKYADIRSMFQDF